MSPEPEGPVGTRARQNLAGAGAAITVIQGRIDAAVTSIGGLKLSCDSARSATYPDTAAKLAEDKQLVRVQGDLGKAGDSLIAIQTDPIGLVVSGRIKLAS